MKAQSKIGCITLITKSRNSCGSSCLLTTYLYRVLGDLISCRFIGSPHSSRDERNGTAYGNHLGRGSGSVGALGANLYLSFSRFILSGIGQIDLISFGLFIPAAVFDRDSNFIKFYLSEKLVFFICSGSAFTDCVSAI